MSYNKIRKDTQKSEKVSLASFIIKVFGPLAPWQEKHLDTLKKQTR